MRFRTPVLALCAAVLAVSPSVAAAQGPHKGNPAVRYVALGDSYSAGEGLPNYVKGTDTSADRCHRSVHSYPERLREIYVGTFADFACSGAQTPDVYGRTQHPRERSAQALHPQVRKADLVTLTIGGNDVDFSGRLVYCAKHHSCNKSASLTGSIDDALALLPTELDAAYNTIRRHVRARKYMTVAVLGYPQLFPERSAAQHCVRLHGAFGVSLFDSGEQNYLNAKARQVDGIVRAAAKRAGFFYLSAISTFRGHAQCDPGPLLNGITKGKGISVGPGAFHPNTAGQHAYAYMVQRLLGRTSGAKTPVGLPEDPRATAPLPPPGGGGGCARPGRERAAVIPC